MKSLGSVKQKKNHTFQVCALLKVLETNCWPHPNLRESLANKCGHPTEALNQALHIRDTHSIN